MFFLSPKPKQKVATDIDGILEEGRDWVTRLATASKETTAEAEIMTKHIIHLEIKRNNLQSKANEAKEISDNFKAFLYPKKN